MKAAGWRCLGRDAAPIVRRWCGPCDRGVCAEVSSIMMSGAAAFGWRMLLTCDATCYVRVLRGRYVWLRVVFKFTNVCAHFPKKAMGPTRDSAPTSA